MRPYWSAWPVLPSGTMEICGPKPLPRAMSGSIIQMWLGLMMMSTTHVSTGSHWNYIMLTSTALPWPWESWSSPHCIPSPNLYTQERWLCPSPQTCISPGQPTRDEHDAGESGYESCPFVCHTVVWVRERSSSHPCLPIDTTSGKRANTIVMWVREITLALTCCST